jgi:hypothetical protein
MTSPKLVPTARKFAARVRLVDFDGAELRSISAEEAEELLATRRVEAKGTKTRIRVLKYLEEDRSIYGGGCDKHRRRLAEAHRSESDTNVRGVWSFEPMRCAPTVFIGVIKEVLRPAA